MRDHVPAFLCLSFLFAFTLACGGGDGPEVLEVTVAAPAVEIAPPMADPEPEAAAVPEDPADEPEVEPAGEPAVAGGKHVGTLKASRSGVVTLTTSGGDTPPKGTHATLSKEVQKKVFGMDVTAWIGIAEVEVTSASDSEVVCKVLEETTNIVVNGKKEDMFTKGSPTQLVW